MELTKKEDSESNQISFRTVRFAQSGMEKEMKSKSDC